MDINTSTNDTANKRLIRNSIYMCLRMVFVLGLSLYTTRLILEVLGVEDYGIYNVVCGFVSMFAFLNASMANGVQRFFSYEIGRIGSEGTVTIFNISVIIQISLSLIIVVLVETFGLWYLYDRMVIPSSRFDAAFWVFQASVVSFILIVLQVPYTAAIIAYEKMDFYSIISIIDALLKLLIVVILPFSTVDHLMLYGFLFVFINAFDLFAQIIYVRFNFPRLRFKRNINIRMLKEMLSFSGWNIFGSFSHMMKEQGINLVINFFCGPIVNAARGVAFQVNSGMQSFIQNIAIPVRPQVIQSYAEGNYERTMNLTYSVSKLSCYFLYILSLPIIAEINFILKIWLGDNVPAHTSSFIFITIMVSFINNLNAPISNVVHASGRMRNYQLLSSLAVLSSIFFAYFVMKLGAEPEVAIWMSFVSMLFAQVIALLILKTIVSYSLKDYCKEVFVPFFYVVITTLWVPFFLHALVDEGFVRLILVILLCIISILLSAFFIGLNSREKEIFVVFFKNFF